MIDGAGVEAGRGQRATDGLGDNLHEPLVAHPALLPDVVEPLVLPAVVIDEIGGVRGVSEQLRNAVAFADEQRCGRVAGGELQRACGLRPALLGARHEHRLAAATGDPACSDQRRRPCPLRPGDVKGSHRAGEAKGLGDNTGVLTVLKRQGRRGEEDLRDTVTSAPPQAVARRLDRHRDRILVPVRDGALAASECHEGGVEPGVGLGNRSALQTQPRDVAAEGVDAGAHRRALPRSRGAALVTSRPGRGARGIPPFIPDPN